MQLWRRSKVTSADATVRLALVTKEDDAFAWDSWNGFERRWQHVYFKNMDWLSMYWISYGRSLPVL